jgi:hypothetical protein
MLMSIPVISPIELSLPSYDKLLPAPDQSGIQDAEYTVQESTTAPTTPRAAFLVASPALIALNEIEQAAEVGQYHDFGWWRQRINTIREAVKRADTPIDPRAR